MKSFKDSEIVIHLNNGDRLVIHFDSKFIFKEFFSSAPLSEDFNSFLSNLVNVSLDEIYDLSFDLKNLSSGSVWHELFEKLRFEIACLLGRDYLYHTNDPVVCSCFGIRASEISMNPKKLGKGCRTCLSFLTPKSSLNQKNKIKKYKSVSLADWVLFIDKKLKENKNFESWNLSLLNLDFPNLILSFNKNASQSEEEWILQQVQNYLRSEVDEGIFVFFKSS